MVVFLRDMERNFLCNDMNNGLCNDMNNGFGIIRTDIPDRYSGQIFRTDIFNTTNLVYLYQEMSGTLCHRSEGFKNIYSTMHINFFNFSKLFVPYILCLFF